MVMALLKLLFLGSFVLFITGCVTQNGAKDSGKVNYNHLPEWLMEIKYNVHHGKNFKNIPRKAFIFPPLVVDKAWMPLHDFHHVIKESGKIYWSSSAPWAAEISQIVDQALLLKGFRLVDFEELTQAKEEHDILVFNLYFSNPIPEHFESGESGRYLTFLRINAATYPINMEPSEKITHLHIEGVIAFTDIEKQEYAVKQAYQKLLSELSNKGLHYESISPLH
jgi:hypothetical protein